MPYNELNLARITAVAKMDTSTTCGLCLKVVNSADTSKFIYVLAVDLGGSGLDVRPFFFAAKEYKPSILITLI
jgi:hypothetical protein